MLNSKPVQWNYQALFQNLKMALKVNETKVDTENASNWNNFNFGIKNKSKFYERAIFRVSLQNLDSYFDFDTRDNLHLYFKTTVFATSKFGQFPEDVRRSKQILRTVH